MLYTGISYLALLTLNTVLIGQAPPKLYQNHHLDPISLLMDGSGLLKPGSGSAKKSGSIRIWNTDIFSMCHPCVSCTSQPDTANLLKYGSTLIWIRIHKTGWGINTLCQASSWSIYECGTLLWESLFLPFQRRAPTQRRVSYKGKQVLVMVYTGMQLEKVLTGID